MKPARVVAMTMTRDESLLLPHWVEYYGGQLGVENLIVLDDNSVDGSTDGLPCPVVKLPAEPWKLGWGKTRRTLTNGMAVGLLGCYDVVMYTDVDEFIVPDPAHYDGLIDFLSTRSLVHVVAPLAFNVLHDAKNEPPLDPSGGLLAQRSLIKFVPSMCKPLLKRITADWSLGFHGIHTPFEIDPELLMFHLKYFDADHLKVTAEHRFRAFDVEGRGGAKSAWALEPHDLWSRLSSWVEHPADTPVPELDVGEIDLSEVVIERTKGFFRTTGSPIDSMDTYPLLRVPERFRAIL